jgi:hypothetical protein
VASVKAGEWCPSTIWTCLAFHPERKSIEAYVWRRVWKPIHSTPARAAAGFSTRREMFSGTSGVPLRLGKTSASSPLAVATAGCR